MNATTHRCFLALPLDSSLKKIAKQLRTQIALEIGKPNEQHLRWIKNQNLHLTLYFLGNQTQPAITKLSDSLMKNSHFPDSFTIHFKLLTLFPLKHPRIVALIGDINSGLNALITQLKRTLIELQITFDDKPLLPHISLARCDKSIDLKPMELNLELEVNKFTLFKSVTASDGAIYTPLQEFLL